MGTWNCVLELDSTRRITNGSSSVLQDSIRRGADLRIYTEFRHNEHIDVTSTDPSVVLEMAEFRTTYLVQNSWVAGIMTLRQPIELPNSFGQPPSMSFFLYNEDGNQGIARPFLVRPSTETEVPPPGHGNKGMPKFQQFDSWDTKSFAPSHNFIYDFDVFRFWVWDGWEEVLAHDKNGTVKSGSIESLEKAFVNGSEIKVGIENLCMDLSEDATSTPNHEVFIQLNSSYFYTDNKLLIGATQPLVRVSPAVPMTYQHGNWDFGWVIVRTDGSSNLRLTNPYDLGFVDTTSAFGVRWFVR